MTRRFPNDVVNVQRAEDVAAALDVLRDAWRRGAKVTLQTTFAGTRGWAVTPSFALSHHGETGEFDDVASGERAWTTDVRCSSLDEAIVLAAKMFKERTS